MFACIETCVSCIEPFVACIEPCALNCCQVKDAGGLWGRRGAKLAGGLPCTGIRVGDIAEEKDPSTGKTWYWLARKERSTSDTLTISKKEQQSPSKSGRESKMLEWSEDTWANMMLEDTKEDRREPQESIEQLLQKAQVSFDSMNALLRDVQKLGIKMASSSTKSSSAASLIKVGLGLVKDLRTHSDRLQEALVTERELQQPGQMKDPP